MDLGPAVDVVAESTRKVSAQENWTTNTKLPSQNPQQEKAARDAAIMPDPAPHLREGSRIACESGFGANRPKAEAADSAFAKETPSRPSRKAL